MPSGVYERGPSKAKRKTIRTLRPGEPRPEGEPYRYPDRDGYVRLRWKVGTAEYVELREHRTIAPDDRHVHHIDHDPSNNDLTNLVVLTPTQHRALHANERRTFDLQEAKRLYEAGWSTPQIGAHFGVAASGIWRGLHSIGYQMRPAGGRHAS